MNPLREAEPDDVTIRQQKLTTLYYTHCSNGRLTVKERSSFVFVLALRRSEKSYLLLRNFFLCVSKAEKLNGVNELDMK